MTAFTVTVDDAAVHAALRRLRQHTDDLGPALHKIGELLVDSIQDRFASASAPDGTPWAANSPVTIARYLGLSQGKERAAKAAGKKPLTGKSGALRSQIHHQVTGNVLEVGSTMEYAAMQQFGGQKSDFPHLWGDIPARPFLGISDSDRAGIAQTITDYLAG
jgi:phage virion morphogenesis protein